MLAQLRRLYGDRVETPTHVHITDWQDDPFAHGSYAYMTVGSTTADHDALATPVGGILHLAGEATWTDDPATVTAAMYSGHRAAQNILGREIPIERRGPMPDRHQARHSASDHGASASRRPRRGSAPCR